MFELKFVARATDIDRWIAICELMENGDCGINLQEQMEVFGVEVDKSLSLFLIKGGLKVPSCLSNGSTIIMNSLFSFTYMAWSKEKKLSSSSYSVQLQF